MITAIAYVQPVALTSVIMLYNKWISGSQQTRTSCRQDIMWSPFEKFNKRCWVHKFNLTILFLKINTKYYFYIQLGIISTCNIIEYWLTFNETFELTLIKHFVNDLSLNYMEYWTLTRMLTFYDKFWYHKID